MFVLSDGHSSMSHLALADGSTARFSHVRVASADKTSTAVLLANIQDGTGNDIASIDFAKIDLFVDGRKAEPQWSRGPGEVSLALILCVPSRVGVAGDRSADSIHQAVLGALDELDGNRDQAAVIVYDEQAATLEKLSKATPEFVKRVDDSLLKVKPKKTSGIVAALDRAFSLIEDRGKKRQPAIIMIADTAVGEISNSIDGLASLSRETGATVDILGVDGAAAAGKDVEKLAKRCGGNFSMANSSRELKRLARAPLRNLKSAYQFGVDVDPPVGANESMSAGVFVRLPSGTLSDEVVYTHTASDDWLKSVGDEQAENAQDATPMSSAELYFTLATLGVLLVSMAIPFVRFGKRARPQLEPAEEVKVELPPERKPEPQAALTPPKREVEAELPSPPPVKAKPPTPKRPPPVRRDKDLR